MQNQSLSSLKKNLFSAWGVQPVFCLYGGNKTGVHVEAPCWLKILMVSRYSCFDILEPFDNAT